ncbi:hypothetical protein SB847_21325, partial [Bacillus sp. SIMBA_026]
KGYVVTGVTAGLTAGLYDQWTGTETATGTSPAIDGHAGQLANSGTVTGATLNTWQGIGQFAANQALQNGTSVLLERALGGDAKLSDA